jgi:hypothetical protein
MSDTSDPKEVIKEELTEQVDVGSLVTGESVGDQVDGESLGRSFGESVGALAGRKLGRLAVGRLLSKLPFRDGGDGNPSFLRRLARSFVVALGKTLSQPQFRDPIEKTLREYVEKREAAGTLDDAKETAEEAAEKASETAGGDADEASDSAENEDGAEEKTGGLSTNDLNPDDVQAIREETYRELLETMEYSELQSIAKEVDVKANLGRDDLVDAIVEQFNDESEQDGGEGGDESDAE